MRTSATFSTSGSGAGMTIKLELTGFWNRVDAMLDPGKWERALTLEIDRATRINCMYLAREVRQRIRGRKYRENATLTAILKGSSNPTPLVDRGDLFKAITWKRIGRGTYLTGILRTARTARDEETAQLAINLHEGKSIAVTERMRTMFWHLSMYSKGEMSMADLTGRARELAGRLKKGAVVHELGPNVRYIVIPPRPFLVEPFTDPAVRRKIIENWRQGVERALTRIAKA